MTIDSAVFDTALAMLRATAGAISIAIAVVNFPRAMLITPHREWALIAVMVLGLGGLLMVLGLGGPIAPGLVAETLLVSCLVSILTMSGHRANLRACPGMPRQRCRSAHLIA